MPAATDQLETLRAAVRCSVATDAESRGRFSVDGVTPSAVVEPENAKELIEIVRWARAHRAGLLPVTSGAFLPIGNPPAAADVAVSLARMNRVLDYDPGDLTFSVEAGIGIAAVDKLLGEHGQFLPGLAPYFERAGVGGLLAVNASSPLRYAYGTWRDFVLGMRFVTGEGRLVKTGARVVKNVAGYDLSKLMIGSLGTLGIITEVNFKAFPLPPARASFVVGFASLEAALEMRNRIVHSVLQPTVLELVDRAAAQLLPLNTLSPAAWSLLVAASGVEAVLRRYETELAALARETKASSFTPFWREHPLVPPVPSAVEGSGVEGSALWAAVRELIARAREAHPAATVAKCTLPLTQVGAFLTKAAQVAARYELPAAAHAHAGSGIAYIYLLPPADGPDASRRTCPEGVARRMAQAATEMIHAGNNFGGRTTIPWCPTEVKRDVNPWGPVRDDFPLMQKLKAQFDPDRVLNPGRFVGGL
ncbi:MAG: FAD-binding oxidoreductase [Acidobacteria bacterium]|nr:FAD-binding oxidoreductase [Acidobacteriota bacterium]